MQSLLNRIKNSLSFFLLFNLVVPTLLLSAGYQLDNFNPSTNTIDVLYDFDEGDVAGFQFKVEGLTLTGDASGGIAEELDFSVNAGSSTVLGFSFDGISIPEGSGLLTTLSFSNSTADEACLSEIVVTLSGGTQLESPSAGTCVSTVVDLSSGLSLGSFDSSGSVEVLYNFGGPVAGFQFDLTGLALTGASGGAAGDAGLTVSVGGATVVGFSLTNSEIAAGSGVLTVLSFSDITAGTTELSLGNFGAITSADGTVYDASASGSIDHPTDCAGDYYGSAVEDECGVCGGEGSADGGCDCDGGLPRGSEAILDNATSVKLVRDGNSINIYSDGFIGGIQMTIKHGDDFELDLSNQFASDLVGFSAYSTDGYTTTLIAVAPKNSNLFTASGDF